MSVFFTSVIYDRVKSTSIIEVYKSISLFLHYIFSLILKKSSVKLKTKYSKLIIKKSFLTVFITQFIKKQKLISKQTTFKNNQKYKDNNYKYADKLKTDLYFLSSTDFYIDIFKTVLNFLN